MNLVGQTFRRSITVLETGFHILHFFGIPVEETGIT
jgi:hypothetical protein